MTYDWSKIINWRLLSGSHDFPGPDGGTCINEAAIIAAGFNYKKVQSAADCPPCFSPVLSAYLIGINDAMPNDWRQKLMPFVLRLSGSADTSQVEQQRLELIVTRTVQKVVSSAMRAAKLQEQATACAAVKDFPEAIKTAARAARAAWAAWAARAAEAAEAARAARAARAAWAAWAAEAAEAAGAAIWSDCIAIAEEAFAVGNQAQMLDIAEVTERLERAKVGAT